MQQAQLKAEIYKKKNGIYYVKVLFADLGMYITGITVRISPRFGDWWVQMPYYTDLASRKTKRYIEFEKESAIKPPIEAICIEAVEQYDEPIPDKDVVVDPTDEELSKPIDLSQIPF